MRSSFILFVLTSILLLAGCVQTPTQTNVTTTIQNSSTATDTGFGTTTTTLAQTNNPPLVYVPVGLDCGSDYGCFINQTQPCNTASVDLMYNQSWGGFIFSISKLLTVIGTTNSCAFYQKNLAIQTYLNDTFVQGALANGTTQAQVDQTLLDVQTVVSKAIGLEGTCLYSNSSEIQSTLSGWQSSGFYSVFYGTAVCSGSVFAFSNAKPLIK